MRTLDSRIVIYALLTFLLAAAPTQPAYQSVCIKDVPHVKQKPDFCGEACAEMFLRKLGKPWTQEQVFNISGLDPTQGRGCWTAELKTALERIGFRVGPAWYRIDNAKLQAGLEEQFKAMHADLMAGIPSIACGHYSDQPETTEHFRLILGYDAKSDEVIYNEPAEDNAAYRRMKRDLFQKLWPLKTDERTSTAIRFRLEAGKIGDPPRAAEGFTAADYALHVFQLKQKMPKGFSVVIQPPFVVVGDEPRGTVAQRAEQTVKWAVDRLKADYFAKDPDSVLAIWLFKDKASYDKYTREIFKDNPGTPFGYFSYQHKSLIMNIATGGGTLVHEIVHPFMHANFPDCPSWLNEGMGSLYEQCGDRNGHIWGYTNWRLAGLQQSIRKGKVPSFKELASMDSDKFYNDDRGTNYGQSRYLCYYLQEKGLLVKFYRDFVANQKDDPTGYQTLQKVLGEEDMDAFKKKWEAFVLKLSF